MRLVNFVRILLVAAALTGYSAWVLAQRTQHGEPQGEGDVAGIKLLRLEEARSLWHESSTVFLDVRSAPDFDFGHIAGAISLPYEDTEKRLPELQSRLERAGSIIVYCGSRDCGKSLWTAIRLRNEGLAQTVIYPDGWNEWLTHDLPTAGTGR